MSGGRRWHYLGELLLGLAVVASAVAGVYAKHESRRLFTELQSLRSERDRLEVDWGRLLIEQSTWSSHARVEKLARERMHMIEPGADHSRLIAP